MQEICLKYWKCVFTWYIYLQYRNNFGILKIKFARFMGGCCYNLLILQEILRWKLGYCISLHWICGCGLEGIISSKFPWMVAVEKCYFNTKKHKLNLENMGKLEGKHWNFILIGVWQHWWIDPHIIWHHELPKCRFTNKKRTENFYKHRNDIKFRKLLACLNQWQPTLGFL